MGNNIATFVAIPRLVTATFLTEVVNPDTPDDEDGGMIVESITATVDGLTTGLITAGTTFAQITSANSAHIAALPPAIVGRIVRGNVSANGCKLRTVAASNETINGVDADGTFQVTLIANTQFKAECYQNGKWVIAVLGTNNWEFPNNSVAKTYPVPS